jgi:carbon storage regulator
MLVLSRRNGERVRIGQYIEVTVLESQNGRVKLGFTAPPDVPIHREEVFRQIAQEVGPAREAVGV